MLSLITLLFFLAGAIVIGNSALKAARSECMNLVHTYYETMLKDAIEQNDQALAIIQQVKQNTSQITPYKEHAFLLSLNYMSEVDKHISIYFQHEHTELTNYFNNAIFATLFGKDQIMKITYDNWNLFIKRDKHLDILHLSPRIYIWFFVVILLYIALLLFNRTLFKNVLWMTSDLKHHTQIAITSSDVWLKTLKKIYRNMQNMSNIL